MRFWDEHPALLLSISFLIGSAFSLFSYPLWLALPWFFYTLLIKKWSGACAIPLAALYAHLLIGPMPQLEQPLTVTAPFTISSLQPHHSPFHKDVQVHGTLHYNGARLPCTIYLPPKNRPAANSDYLVTGTLLSRPPCDYILKAKHWRPIPHTFSLAEFRYQAKQSFRRFLESKLSPRASTLLSSLATGEVEDRQLRFEFSRLGLQHILAISGFHFGLLLAFFSAALSLFLSKRPKWLLLILLTTTYYLFIGSSPAVQRAWLTATLFLFAKLLGRQTSGVNILGASLLIELILNPLVAANLGFQLSFGCSLGILLLHPPISRLLQPLFPIRTPSQSARLSPPSQIVYLLSTTFRSAIALTLSVNTAILPLLLYHFGRFPYLSILYNLFYPLLISTALFLLIATLLIHLLFPPIAIPLFALLNTFTNTLLELTSHPPLLLDYSLYTPPFPPQLISLYLFALLLLALRDRQLRHQLY